MSELEKYVSVNDDGSGEICSGMNSLMEMFEHWTVVYYFGYKWSIWTWPQHSIDNIFHFYVQFSYCKQFERKHIFVPRWQAYTPNCCTHCIWCYINPPHTIRWHHLFSFHLAKSKTFVQMFHIKVQLGMKMKKKKKKKEQWESKQRTSIWTRTYIVHICGSVTIGAMLQPLQKPYT